MNVIIVPKLGLRDMTDAEFDVYVAQKLDTVPVVFPVTNPSIGTVAALHASYHQAVVAWVRGMKETTSLKRQLRRQLHLLVSRLAHNCVALSKGNVTTYLQTGFDRRQKDFVPSPLPAPADFKLIDGDDGQLIATFNKVKNNHGYTVVLSTDADFSIVKNLMTFPASNGQVLITGLVSGTRYYGRARANGSGNQPGEWSDFSARYCP